MANRKIESETRSSTLAVNLTPTLLREATELAGYLSMSRSELTVRALRYYIMAETSYGSLSIAEAYTPETFAGEHATNVNAS